MRVVVLGAGPIGLEAAVEAESRGHEVVVYEAGEVGEHVRRWGHVTLFTPWRLAITERGAARIGSAPDPGGYPSGAELVERYLEPLAATLTVHRRHRVVQIGRTRHRKGHAIGSDTRAADPFRILLETPDGPRVAAADVVLDCTGVFGDPSPAGAGGVPAPGEQEVARGGGIRYGPAPVQDLGGERVLLVGAGASAATVLSDLLALFPPPAITWITPSAQVPGFVSPADDPLPARRALHDLARAAAAHPAVRHRPGALVDRLERGPAGIRVDLTDGSAVEVDHVVACAGFRPDHALARELQLHLCYASEGPMKLAAALLAASGAGGDCLAQPAQDATTLRNPEPRYLVLGNKSYGRRSDFLLRVGHQQVRDALDLLRT